MQVIREHIAFKILWFVLALYIFNCSVDNPDPQPNNVPEDLTFNDMESIVEVVLEQVMDIDNAIAEHDDNDTDHDNGLTIKKEVDFSYYQNSTKLCLNSDIAYALKHNQYTDCYSEQFHPEITPPPPKA